MFPIILLCIIIACACLAGGILGRYIFPSLPVIAEPLRFDISDSAVARIVHEARRAYRQALGDFSVRSWNNLETGVRSALIKQVNLLRKGYVIAGGGFSAFEHRVLAGIADLAKRH